MNKQLNRSNKNSGDLGIYNPMFTFDFNKDDPLCIQLNEHRNKIDSIASDTWKQSRYLVNDYDFSVSPKIINRAFYKFWEIIHEFNIFDKNYFDNKKDLILHTAEAPGGFIQATSMFLKLSNKQQIFVDSDGFTTKEKIHKKIYTISLNKDLPKYKKYNLPEYNKTIISSKFVTVTYGADNTGDINNFENIKHLEKLCLGQKFYLITSDAGFDEGTDFNNKEQLHTSLISNCILSAIKLQKDHGIFVLKVFDTFTDTFKHLVYLLTITYDQVYMYKPKTSRPTNSEKYLICKNFNPTPEFKESIINILFEINSKGYKSFQLFQDLPYEFLKSIDEANKLFVNEQCKYLNTAINISMNTVNTVKWKLTPQKQQKFKDWCQKYNLVN